MKIGIVTFWWTDDNYGQILQCYALQYFLKSIGHEPFLIKTYPNDYGIYKGKRYLLMKFLKYMKIDHIFNIIKNKSIDKQVVGVDSNNRNFECFRNKYIVSTSHIYKYHDLLEKPPIADMYITGSDQVWCLPSPVYFLNWGESRIKRYSYAASFGFENSSSHYLAKITPWLKKFDYISVRESSGIKICKQAGRNDAKCVPDPTLLLSKDVYLNLIDDKDIEKCSYILLYLLGNKINFNIEEVYTFAKENSLKVVYVASQGRFDNYLKEYPTVERWLSLVNGAKYVITNSFHGTVFSILFKRNFMVIPLSGKDSRMNTRIENLLSNYDLMDRIYKGDLNEMFHPVSFLKYESKITNERENVALSFIEK